MTTSRNGTKSRSKGSVVLTMLLLTMVTLAVVGSYMEYATADVRLSRRMIDYQKARMAAEVGLEFAVLRLRNQILENQFSLSRSVLQSRLDTDLQQFASMSNPVPGYVYTASDGDSTLRLTVDSDVYEEQIITQGSQCPGLQGDFQFFTITCGARNPDTGVGAVLRMRLQALGVFLIRYAIFYENDLELFPGRPMIVRGRVHSNDGLYLGADSGGSLSITDRVTTSGILIAGLGKDGRNMPGTTTVDDITGFAEPFKRSEYTLDGRYQYWISEALNVWDGNVLSGAHGIQDLRPPIAPIDSPREIIERPGSTNTAAWAGMTPTEQQYFLTTESEKFANRAELYIHVKANGTIAATNGNGACVTSVFTNMAGVRYSSGAPVKATTGPTNGHYIVTNSNPYACLTTTNRFYDDRENREVDVVDIYVDRFVNTLNSMGSNGGTEGLVYVTRDTNVTGRIPAVRLRNGSTLNTPLSIASDCPVYVEGNYNLQHNVPAMVAGDAITMLSINWQDARSWGDNDLSDRTPKATTNNVVLLTGNTETAGTAYNGGVENVLRFLENWASGSTRYLYRGSIIDLWYSHFATNSWSYGNYYTAPNRDWGYDQQYRTRHPPGMTRVFGLEEIEWSEASWSEAGF